MNQSLSLLVHLLGSYDPAMCMTAHTSVMEVIRMVACVHECEDKEQGDECDS